MSKAREEVITWVQNNLPEGFSLIKRQVERFRAGEGSMENGQRILAVEYNPDTVAGQQLRRIMMSTATASAIKNHFALATGGVLNSLTFVISNKELSQEWMYKAQLESWNKEVK